MELQAKVAFTGCVDGERFDKAEGDRFEATGKKAAKLIARGVAVKATKAAAKKKEA